MLILSTSLLLFLYKCCLVGQWAVTVTVTSLFLLSVCCSSLLHWVWEICCYRGISSVWYVAEQGNWLSYTKTWPSLTMSSRIPAGRIEATNVVISYCKFVGCKQNHSNTEDTFLKRFGRSRTSQKPTHQLANIWPHKLMVVMSPEWAN